MPAASANLIRAAAAVFHSGEELPTLDMVPCVCGGTPKTHRGDKGRGACTGHVVELDGEAVEIDGQAVEIEPCPCTRYRPHQAVLYAVRAAEAQRKTFNQDLRAYDALNPHQGKAEGEISVRFSDVGECRKAIEYRNFPPEGFVPDPEDKRAAYIGTLIHDATLMRRRKLYPWRIYGDLPGNEVYLPGLDRPGHADEFDPITGEVVDLKSAGNWRWDLVGDHGADEKWWKQLRLYGLAYHLMGYTVTTLKVLVIERAGGNDEFFTEPFDVDAAYAVLDELTALATALELRVPQPRDRKGPTLDPICARCFARSDCWNIPAAERAGRSPESFTVLGETPEEQAIIQVIAERVDRGQVRLDAEKAEKEMKVLLDGIEPGTYGPYEGWSKPNTQTLWQAAYQHLLGLYAIEDPEKRPSVDELPEVEKRKTWSVQWTKMRKATLEALERRRKEALAAKAEELAASLTASPEPLALEAGTTEPEPSTTG